MELLEEDGTQPRQDFSNIPDLAISLFNAGQLEACEVRLVGDKAVFTNGARRFRAAKYVNDHYVEWTKQGAVGVRFDALLCKAEPKNLSADERLMRQIQQGGENLSLPLNALELAKAYKRLMDVGWTFAKIGQRVGKSAQQVSNTMSLIDAPKELQDAVESGNMSATAAAKATKATPEKRQKAVDKVKAGEKVQVKDVSEYVPLGLDKARKVIQRADNFRAAAQSKTEEARWEGVVHGIQIGVGLRPVEF
jgi:hypothetical protein